MLEIPEVISWYYHALSITIKVNGKLQRNSARTAHGPDPSGMKIGVTPPGKETRPAEVLAEDKGNTRRLGEKDSNNTSCDHVTSCRYESYNCHEYFLLILLCICVFIYVFGKRLRFFPLLFPYNVL